MLYDILSPLLFFMSFGGIILISSRVVMRVKRQEVSSNFRAHVQSSTSVSSEHVLEGIRGHVQLKSRVGLLLSFIRQIPSDIKTSLQHRREHKLQKKALSTVAQDSAAAEDIIPSGKVMLPGMSWRDKAMNKLHQGSENTRAFFVQAKERARVRFNQAKVTSVPLEATSTVEQEIIPTKPKTEVRIMRIEKPITITTKKIEQEQPNSVQGRFTAKVHKAEKPQVSALMQAMEAIEEAHFDQAEEILVPYLVEHAKDTSAYMLLGKVAMARGAWEEAFEIFQQVVRIDDSAPDAQAQLGCAAIKQGKFTIALLALQRAHEVDPRNIGILEQLLAIAQRLDNHVLQKSVLEQLVDLQPEKDVYAQDLDRLLQREKAKTA